MFSLTFRPVRQLRLPANTLPSYSTAAGSSNFAVLLLPRASQKISLKSTKHDRSTSCFAKIPNGLGRVCYSIFQPESRINRAISDVWNLTVEHNELWQSCVASQKLLCSSQFRIISATAERQAKARQQQQTNLVRLHVDFVPPPPTRMYVDLVTFSVASVSYYVMKARHVTFVYPPFCYLLIITFFIVVFVVVVEKAN